MPIRCVTLAMQAMCQGFAACAARRECRRWAALAGVMAGRRKKGAAERGGFAGSRMPLAAKASAGTMPHRNHAEERRMFSGIPGVEAGWRAVRPASAAGAPGEGRAAMRAARRRGSRLPPEGARRACSATRPAAQAESAAAGSGRMSDACGLSLTPPQPRPNAAHARQGVLPASADRPGGRRAPCAAHARNAPGRRGAGKRPAGPGAARN